jgi:hypothetical protein
MILCCWPCNSGRASLTLAEVQLLDPRDRLPRPAPGWEQWDGLAAFVTTAPVGTGQLAN